MKEATPELKQQVLAMLSQNSSLPVPSKADTSSVEGDQTPLESNVATVESPIVSEASFENDNTREKINKDAWDVADQELQNAVIDFI